MQILTCPDFLGTTTIPAHQVTDRRYHPHLLHLGELVVYLNAEGYGHISWCRQGIGGGTFQFYLILLPQVPYTSEEIGK